MGAAGQRQCNTFASARNPGVKGWYRLILVTLVVFTLAYEAHPAAPEPFTNALALAREKYTNSMATLKEKTGNLEAAWQAGRAAFELAEFAQRKEERAQLAEEGMEASRSAIALQSNSAPAHYYLAMNLGQLMRTKGWSGVRYLGQLRREFEMAVELDPKIDFAGPERNLGYLYRDTPGFAGGSRREAEKHLRRAVQLEPDYPENRLALIEGLMKWDEREDAQKQLQALEALWPKARERLSGPEFGPAWADWEARLRHIKEKLK